MMKKASTFLLAVVLFFTSFHGFSFTKAASATQLSAPSNVKAWAETHDCVELSWDKVSGASGYTLFYLSNGTYEELRSVDVARYTDLDSIKEKTTYVYKVRAYGYRNGHKIFSNFSKSVSVTTPAQGPECLIALLADQSIKLGWEGVSAASGYALYRSYSYDTGFTLLKTTTAVNYTDTDIEGNKSYYYKVRYFTKTASKTIYSGFSATQCATTIPQAPEDMNADDMSSDTIRLTKCLAPDTLGTIIYRSEAKTGQYKPIKTIKTDSYLDTGLKANTSYFYKLRTYRKMGGKTFYGPFSSVITAKTLPQGKKYLRVLFIGDSFVFVPATQTKLAELAKAQHKYLKLYPDMIPLSQIQDHVGPYKKGAWAYERATADIVIVQGTYPPMMSKYKEYFRELMSLVNKNAKYYYFPVCEGTPSVEEVKSLEISGLPGVKNLKSDYAYYYMLSRYNFELFFANDHFHKNDFYGCVCAAAIYCTLYKEDAMTLSNDFFRGYPIPGDTQAEVEKTITYIKQCVNKAMKLNE